MGKTPVRMKAVVYALSPFQQKVMSGLWKDIHGKIHHKVTENWLSTILLLGPLVGTYSRFLNGEWFQNQHPNSFCRQHLQHHNNHFHVEVVHCQLLC